MSIKSLVMRESTTYMHINRQHSHILEFSKLKKRNQIQPPGRFLLIGHRGVRHKRVHTARFYLDHLERRKLNYNDKNQNSVSDGRRHSGKR